MTSHGGREFYRGLVPILLRNGPSNVLFFWGRDVIAQQWPNPSTRTVHLVSITMEPILDLKSK
jgi:hypothetical protein